MSYLPEPTTFELPPAGTHLAICYRVLDLGTQPGGQYGPQHKIMIAWELPDEAMEDGRPFSVTGWYTWTMGEKSNLRKMLQGWRGKPFDASDFKGPNRFDIKNILGKPCLITIVHNDVGEKTYANVNTVSGLVKGQKAPPPINPLQYFWLSQDRFDGELLAKLPDGLKTKIMASPEYKRLTGANGGKLSHPHDHGQDGDYNELNPPPQDQFDDAIPF